MSSVKVSGNASGTGEFTIAAPNSNTNRTLTLPDATGTVQVSGNPISGTTGTFSGAVQASGVTTNIYPIVSGTAVASTSGTSINFTDIPSWVKRITVMFQGVSVSGSSNLLVQIGTSSGIEATGYLSSGMSVDNANVTRVTQYTTGYGIRTGASSAVSYGIFTICLVSSNSWVASGNFSKSDVAEFNSSAGGKTLSATLDRVRITTVNGTDTFDAGSINILYE